MEASSRREVTDTLEMDYNLFGKMVSLLSVRNAREAELTILETALLCQFHDVLPGSAIGLVYEDAEKVSYSLFSFRS